MHDILTWLSVFPCEYKIVCLLTTPEYTKAYWSRSFDYPPLADKNMYIKTYLFDSGGFTAIETHTNKTQGSSDDSRLKRLSNTFVFRRPSSAALLCQIMPNRFSFPFPCSLKVYIASEICFLKADSLPQPDWLGETRIRLKQRVEVRTANLKIGAGLLDR